MLVLVVGWCGTGCRLVWYRFLRIRVARPFRGAVTRKGLVPMSKRRRILLMLARGGLSQADVAAVLHAGKRDVSAASRMIRSVV